MTSSLAETWFTSKGWTPRAFQRRAWAAQARGASGLINVPTGAGKTLAVFGGLLERLEAPSDAPCPRVLYVTPIKALARDVADALREPIEGLGLSARVGVRTGDTSSHRRRRQRDDPPDVLVTTPESLALWLSREDAPRALSGVAAVVLDEWHELAGSKRGALMSLCVERCRAHAPDLMVWALSATVADMDAFARAAVGATPAPPVVVREDLPREVVVDLLEVTSLPPLSVDRSTRGVNALARELLACEAALVFTNSRSAAERWFQALEKATPSLAGQLGLHHGSLDRAERERAERGLASGELRAVVATSSLDLGLDLERVDRVFQVGAPRRADRVVQRAGRANHRRGGSCPITFVPTTMAHPLETLATREAIARGEVEPTAPPRAPLDVLAQHMVTCAMGGGFEPDAFFDQVRGAAAYADLTREAFDWALAFVEHGGATLRAYPDYHKVTSTPDGRRVVSDAKVARRHRLTIGTITTRPRVRVRLGKGRALGEVDEDYVARLRPGDAFVFAGQALELERLHEDTAWVRPARGRAHTTPRWSGEVLPLSPVVSASLRRVMDAWRRGDARDPEDALAARAHRALALQHRLAHVPTLDETACEVHADDDGHHLCVFPFEGRPVHEGLAAILALRIARAEPATLALSATSYGLSLTSAAPIDFAAHLTPALFTREGLEADALEAMNMAELARRSFRGVARTAGLVFDGFPGQKRRGKPQTSAALLFDVFTRYDPGHLLLRQAHAEVLERQLEGARLGRALDRLAATTLVVRAPARLTPWSAPLVLGRARDVLSTETLRQRIERMRSAWTEADT
jgi:ATP-dependent Lhr-like helicase